MYHMDADKVYRVKAWREFHENASNYIKQILEAKQQLYSHLPPICKTIQIRRTRHVGHCWRSKVELISDVLTDLFTRMCKC